MAAQENPLKPFIRFYMERMLGCAAVPNDDWGFILDNRFYLSFMPGYVGSTIYGCALKVSLLHRVDDDGGFMATRLKNLTQPLCCVNVDDDAGMEKLKLQLRTLCIDLLFDQF